MIGAYRQNIVGLNPTACSVIISPLVLQRSVDWTPLRGRQSQGLWVTIKHKSVCYLLSKLIFWFKLCSELRPQFSKIWAPISLQTPLVVHACQSRWWVQVTSLSKCHLLDEAHNTPHLMHRKEAPGGKWIPTRWQNVRLHISPCISPGNAIVKNGEFSIKQHLCCRRNRRGEWGKQKTTFKYFHQSLFLSIFHN